MPAFASRTWSFIIPPVSVFALAFKPSLGDPFLFQEQSCILAAKSLNRSPIRPGNRELVLLPGNDQRTARLESSLSAEICRYNHLSLELMLPVIATASDLRVFLCVLQSHIHPTLETRQRNAVLHWRVDSEGRSRDHRNYPHL